jgi:hypothetical protein
LEKLNEFFCRRRRRLWYVQECGRVTAEREREKKEYETINRIEDFTHEQFFSLRSSTKPSLLLCGVRKGK